MTMADAVRIVKDDPDFIIKGASAAFADTANPYFAWLALEACLRHEMEIPDRLRRYLLQCAERMQSRGLREVLPGRGQEAAEDEKARASNEEAKAATQAVPIRR
jgi:hypothetical protein